MPVPPKLPGHFGSVGQRESVRDDLLLLGRRLRYVQAVDAGVADMPADLRAAIAGALPPAAGRISPTERLRQFVTVFAEEIATALDVTESQTVVAALDDDGLRQAHYLLLRLFANLLGCPNGEVVAQLQSWA